MNNQNGKKSIDCVTITIRKIEKTLYFECKKSLNDVIVLNIIALAAV